MIADWLVIIGGRTVLFRFCLIAAAYVAACVLMFWGAS